MAQPSPRKRSGFIVHVPGPGIQVQLYGPAPDDWADEDALWGELAAWEQYAGVQLRIDYDQTPDGPENVAAVALTDELAARMPLMPSEGAVQIRSVELRRRDGQPLSRRALGRMGLGTVHRALAQVLASPIARAHLGQPWTVELPRGPGRRGTPDLEYARWAAVYAAAVEQAPTRPVHHMIDTGMIDHLVADPSHVTNAEVRARLRRARERGLLTSAAAGVAGGELTDKAKTLLDDAGLL